MKENARLRQVVDTLMSKGNSDSKIGTINIRQVIFDLDLIRSKIADHILDPYCSLMAVLAENAALKTRVADLERELEEALCRLKLGSASPGPAKVVTLALRSEKEKAKETDLVSKVNQHTPVKTISYRAR